MANQLQPLMDAILLCLCTKLASEGRPVCECCAVVSDEPPPMVGCDCVCTEPDGGQGRAWIRFVDSQFKQSDPVRCPIGPWNVDLQIGIYRCASSETDCVSLAADAGKLQEDMATLERAIRCCDALTKKNKTINSAKGLKTGGCMGAYLDFTVEMPAL